MAKNSEEAVQHEHAVACEERVLPSHCQSNKGVGWQAACLNTRENKHVGQHFYKRSSNKYPARVLLARPHEMAVFWMQNFKRLVVWSIVSYLERYAAGESTMAEGGLVLYIG